MAGANKSAKAGPEPDSPAKYSKYEYLCSRLVLPIRWLGVHVVSMSTPMARCGYAFLGV